MNIAANDNRIPRTNSLRAAIAMFCAAAAAPALGQEAAQSQSLAGGQSIGRLEEVVVTGTRRAGQSAEESMRPIDIVSAETLSSQGASNLNDALRTAVPSLNVQKFVAQDGSAFIRPFSLRGLPPDQTLVLVNGKRRHRAALVQITNQPLAAGAQGPDLAMIPSIAVEQIEVLRDGAAAQYGSDAIAGVINFRLKRDSQGSTVVTRFGSYMDGGGDDLSLQANVGLPLTADGFFNFSFEYVDSDPTSRGTQRPDAQGLIDGGNNAVPVPAQRWGNVAAEAVRAFFNAEVQATDSVTAYAFGNYGDSSGDTEFFYRNPVTRTDIFRSVPLTNQPGGPRFNFNQWFPGGFTPLFGTSIVDSSLTLGARGEWSNGLQFDFSGSRGRSELEYRISNTVNPSLGPESPTSFRPGTIQQLETNFNADFVFALPVAALASPLNVAFGAEWRQEEFEIRPGDEASWIAGPFARVQDPDTGNFIGLAVGSSGFPGYVPASSGTWTRSNAAAYLDLEADVTERLTLGAAARFEDFSDFGNTFNWKVSGRLEVTDWLAIRASANTGFRAPTPGQGNISDVATNIDLVTGGLLLTATRPPYDPISRFYGAQPLTEEESSNYAAGLVFRFPGDWMLTADFFRIEVENRIALTSRIPITAGDRAAMLAQGIDPGDYQTVRFFGNFFDSETEGVDVILSKAFDLGEGSSLLLNAGVNYTSSEISDVKDARAVNREREIEIKEFNPDLRGSLSLDYSRGPWGAVLRASYYGEWTDAVANATPTASSFDQTFGAEWLLDVELRYAVNDTWTLAVGADNVLNEYPDKDARPGQQSSGIVYPQFSPFGFSGGFWYGRVTARF